MTDTGIRAHVCVVTSYRKKSTPEVQALKISKISEKRLEYFRTERGKIFREKLSNDRKGINNPVHKQTAETRERVKNINSIKMKENIRTGRFTPCVTNSWAHSKVPVKVDNKIYKFRSCWEAAYFLLNTHLIYEKIRIPYNHDNETHIYY